MVRIGVHHPGHDLLVGADIGRGDVHIRPDEGCDFLHVTAGKTLQLARRHVAGIDNHAALGSTEGQADQRTFPAHPHGESGDFPECHILMEADSALGGTGREVVLDAVALENLDFAAVHANGHGNNDATFGAFGAIAEAGVHAKDVGGDIELVAGLREYG